MSYVSKTKLSPYLDKIRALDFVKDLRYAPRLPKSSTTKQQIDAFLEIRTPKGTFPFLVEVKNSYLDRGVLNAFITHSRHLEQARKRPIIIFARYVPRPSAEKLTASGINFVDLVGNMHLVLGTNYSRTLIGNRETRNTQEALPNTPAKVQLLFTLAAYEQARDWTVRQLAEASGLSKSNVAKVREQLVKEGVLWHRQRRFELRPETDLEQLLVRGYEDVLRPKLFLGRFRGPELLRERILREKILSKLPIRWALTGGYAAYELQHFYKGMELCLFIDTHPESFIRQLRILPDAMGPLVLLQAFGTVPYWKELRSKTIAHPWLIYCELMRSDDPRAHEAATELKTEFLKP